MDVYFPHTIINILSTYEITLFLFCRCVCEHIFIHDSPTTAIPLPLWFWQYISNHRMVLLLAIHKTGLLFQKNCENRLSIILYFSFELFNFLHLSL